MRQNDDGKTVAAMDLLVPRVGTYNQHNIHKFLSHMNQWHKMEEHPLAIANKLCFCSMSGW